jgi:hypothetical protein
MITLTMNRGQAVRLRALLRQHQGTQDLRLTEYTQSMGEVLDNLQLQLDNESKVKRP